MRSFQMHSMSPSTLGCVWKTPPPTQEFGCYPNSKPWVTSKALLNDKKRALRSADWAELKQVQCKLKHSLKEIKDSYRWKTGGERDSWLQQDTWVCRWGERTMSKQVKPVFQWVWLGLVPTRCSPPSVPPSSDSHPDLLVRGRPLYSLSHSRPNVCTSWGGTGPSMSATRCSRCSTSLLLQAPTSLLWCAGVAASKHRTPTD